MISSKTDTLSYLYKNRVRPRIRFSDSGVGCVTCLISISRGSHDRGVCGGHGGQGSFAGNR